MSVIGKSGRKNVSIDVPTLIESRLALTANSGAGKSWALRKLLEVTYGQAQHPKAGARAQPAPAPRAKIKKVIKELLDLPEQAAAEIRTLTEAKAQISTLKRKLIAAEKGDVTISELAEAETRGRREGLADGYTRGFQYAVESGTAALMALEEGVKIFPKSEPPPPPSKPQRRADADSSPSLTKGELAIMQAIAQYRDGVTPEQLSVLTGYKRSSRNTYLQRLRSYGYLMNGGGRLRATDDGLLEAGDFEYLPTGDELAKYWLRKLPQGESALLSAVLNAGSGGITSDELSATTNYKRSSRNTYLQRLRARELVSKVGDLYVIADILRD